MYDTPCGWRTHGGMWRGVHRWIDPIVVVAAVADESLLLLLYLVISLRLRWCVGVDERWIAAGGVVGGEDTLVGMIPLYCRLIGWGWNRGL